MKPVRPDLLITSKETKFSAEPQVDPEGQTAAIEYQTPVTAGRGGLSQAKTGSGHEGNIPGLIQYQTNVGDMANGARTACSGCKHHDVRAWNKYVDRATGPLSTAEERQEIQTAKNRIAMAGFGYENPDKTVDLEATIRAFGICRPLNDWIEGVVGKNPVHWPVFTWRDSSCPTTCHAGPHTLQVVTPAQPLRLFQPKDLDATKIGAKRYDTVLHAAQAVGKAMK
jgi:hypothetical protein